MPSGLIGYDISGFVAKIKENEPSWVAFHGKGSRNGPSAIDVGLGRSEAPRDQAAVVQVGPEQVAGARVVVPARR